MTKTSHHNKPADVPKIRGDPMLRLAVRLHTQLSATPASCNLEATLLQSIRRVLDQSTALHQIWKNACVAHSKRWDTATATLLRRVPAVAAEVCEMSRTLLRLAAPTDNPPLPPTLGDLVAELHALRGEFGELIIDPHLLSVSVLTDPITLEEVYLGPFRIELHLSELREGKIDGSAFRCIATDPHPASCSDCTTHPHVRDEIPCLGEAVVPIRSALRQGRLADAFLAVQAVLQTYNSSSPFISLSEWEGRSCGDCGGTRSDEDMYHCDACDGSFCESCHSSCDACGHGCCRGCLETGDQDDSLCSDCRGRCAGCRTTASTTALEEQDGLCLACFEHSNPEESDSQAPDSEEQGDQDPPALLTPQLQETHDESVIIPTAETPGGTVPDILGPPAFTVAA